MKKRADQALASFFNQKLRTSKRRTTGRRASGLSLETLEKREVMAAAFFAPPEPTGSVPVQLVPLANVAAGTPEVVTFGVPFTRGSISAAQLSQLRVLKNGVEIPAFVEQLTPWRSIDDGGIDGQSVRVARIQIAYTFTTLNPESITVEWGGAARTQNRPALQDPRVEWHTVTSGTYVAADNVQEPDVLPVLPKAYMSKGMLDARTDPTNGNVAETRDDPGVADAMTFSGYTEYDNAQKNFFYTINNQNPGITVNYKTDPEPWLYDRASGMYELYLRSGFATALREAVRNADFYADHLDASGFFTLKPGDPKYAYNESLAYTYWLLGDSRMLAPISTVVSAHGGTATHWTPNLSFFTERNVGYKLLANEVAYEVTGSANFKNSVQTIVGDLIWHQNGAGGQLPANRIDGGLYHTGEQHDISEASSGSVLIASSWMSALLADPMVRAYGVWQNPQIADFMVRLGNFEKAASKTDSDGQFEVTSRYPDYLMRADGTSDNRSDTDVQHAMDVGAVAAWATYFAELRGTPDASLRQLANDLYATYDVGVNFWTRPGGTNFNVSPPRRYTWEYKNSTSFSWALTGTDAVGQPGNLQFSAATYNANENQGAIIITVARSGGSTGNISVNYATANGTATAGSDYTSTSGTLTFADGQTSATFSIPLLNDADVENAETVTLALSNPTGGAALSSPASAVLTITSDDASNQPITVTLQQGVSGYAGTTDVNISTQYGQYNGGNGTTTANGTQMGVYQLTGTNGYSVESLIRFSDLGITSGGGASAVVSGAKLTLSVDTWVNNPTIRGYYVAAPWTTAAGSDLGWLRRGTGQNWNTPGALGQGTDVIAGKSFVLSGITARGAQSITVDLDPAVVQSWIDNPSSNQGILLVNETTGAVVLVNASENTTQSVRPKLSVTYTVASSSNAGALQFSNAAYAVNETGGTATITVTRSGGSTGAVSIDYATANGTATAGSDYTAASGTLSFAAGETTKTFTVPILNDTLVEGLETIQLTLSNPTGGASLGSQATSTLTITSDDVAQPSVLQFSAANYAINENQGTATITVTRSGDSSAAVSVNYATSNGTATAGSDYTAASGTLNFAAGQSSATFTIPILNDTAVENSETISLVLSNPSSGATLGNQSTAVLTITSDDVALPGVLQFSTATYAINETQTSATITVTRTGGSDVAVSVNYATANGTASAGSDYTAASGTLNFAIGQTSATFIVPIINDTAVESAETVTLNLANPTNGATLGSPASATLTITSDDTGSQPNTVTLQQGVNGYVGTSDVSISTQYAQYTGGNGTTSFGSSQLNVYQTVGTGSYTMESLIRFSNLGISPSSVVSNATLTLNVDTWDVNPIIRGYYVAAPWNSLPGSGNQLGWLHRGTGQDWAAAGARGQGSDVLADKSFVVSGIRALGGQTITVALDPAVVQAWINNPDSNQGVLLVNETPGLIVRIGASESSNVSLRPKLTINFAGDPPAPQPGAFAFSNATYNVGEGVASATITVTRSGGSSGAVSVNYATSNGTATAGSDYTAASGVLNFAAGETTKTFTIPITNDASVEGSETINLALSNPTGGAALGSQNTALLTIQDNDVATQPGALQFSAATYSLAENGGTLNITVTRTGGSDGAVTVQYATSNGTATAGSDYTAAGGTLTFAAGQTSRTFAVALLDDTTVEANETINLTLSSPTGGATLGNPTTATITILENDTAPGVMLPNGFTQTVVASGISSATSMTVAPDGRIFILEQGGAVRVIKNGALLSTPALTVTTVNEVERGLLSLAFDPNFATNHFIYVSYTVGGPQPAPAHDRISRFTMNGDVAVAGSETILYEMPDTTSRVHASMTLKFGSDGKLYIATGNDNVFGNSSSLNNPFGKLLRINADGTIPADNPFFNQTTGLNRAIWALGLRNPNTLDVQPGTGLMYINDVGENSWEEINQGVAGANYGWPNSEGYTTNPLYTSPVYAYAHGTGPNLGFAIIGGAFYNPANPTFPAEYRGKYFFMDYVGGWISYVDPAAPNPKTPTTFASNLPTRYDGGPVDLEVGADGALYYLNRLTGSVMKMQYSAPAPPPTGSFTKVNAASGIDAIIAQKYQEDPNWWLTGQHLIDLDSDGDLDLFLDAHNGSAVVALNDGQGHFTRATSGTWPTSEIHQMADINNDGKLDISVTFQDGGAQWWLNNSTPGHVNFTATNITRGGNSSRAQVLFDFNGDGKLDWLRSEQPGLVIDFGNGSGGFTDGSLSFPIAGTTTNENANFLPGDYDLDGDIDLLIMTGGGYDGTTGKTFYWRNNGNQTFTDATASAGLPATGTVAKGVGDFDQDGDLDLIALENKAMPPVIYTNDGQGHFAKKSGAINGVGSGTLDYSAWGTAITTDFDNDGIADIIMDGKYFLKVLRGTGGGNFTYMNNAWGIQDTAASAVDDGLCFGDIDGDGDLDVIGFNEIFPSRTLNVYRNDLAAKNWLNVRPVGLAGNAAAAGATISLYAPGTSQLLWSEQVAQYDFQVATSYYGASKTERHFGLGDRETVDVVVRFASGKTTRMNGVSGNQTIDLLESAGT